MAVVVGLVLLTLGGSVPWARQDGEWRRGAWTLCDASAEAVFTPQVGKLWEKMSVGSMGVKLCSRVPQSEETWSEHKMAPPREG